MRRGAWHQLGWNHQKAAAELLAVQAGVGVVISPRDLSYTKAQEYAADYKSEGASVLVDPQWYNPGFQSQQLNSYPSSELRDSITSLRNFHDEDFARLRDLLVAENSALQADALIAPAVVYSAGRTDVSALNARLHSVAREASAILKIPCYGTAFMDDSITGNLPLIETTLASITSLHADGWYFGFEFQPERVPSDSEAVYRCLRAALLLRLTGKPVMHAYAGPMGILSFAAGCSAAASGIDQTQWRFCPERFEPATGEGGGGGSDAPPRYFSPVLWGTIVCPDELVLLPAEIRDRILVASPFVTLPIPQTWTRTEAKKHLAYCVAKGIEKVASPGTIAGADGIATSILTEASELHSTISWDHSIELKDESASYQKSWLVALQDLAQKHESDFDFLELLG